MNAEPYKKHYDFISADNMIRSNIMQHDINRYNQYAANNINHLGFIHGVKR